MPCTSRQRTTATKRGKVPLPLAGRSGESSGAEAILRLMPKLATLTAAVLVAALPLAGCDRHDPDRVVDPVCGMDVDPATAAAKSVYKGKTYYFCAKDEKDQFDKDPEKYLKDG